MEKVNKTVQDDDVIDLMELFLALKRKIWLIILAAVIVGGAFGAYSKFVMVPQYQSTAMVYILSKETTLTSLADLQIGSQLTKDYQVIVTSRPVLESVVESLGLGISYKEMAGKISISNPTDTRILTITATDADPMMAKKIADEVANTSSEYIGDIMEMVPPKIIEEGAVPTQKSSPSNKKNALIGAFLGAALICGVVVLETLMNDSIENEEDVAKYLGLSVLASIPEWKDEGITRETEADSHSRKRQKRSKKK